jgi:hypothetical protein
MNPWKLATFGIVTVLITSLSTGLTAAWLMRPASADTEAPVQAQPRYATARARAAGVQPVTSVRPASVRPVALDTAPSDCASTGDRVMRIAKPGLVGALVGAGLGAAGGAIADGGKAAGKGAIIGGLAGTALGAGYGAYKTKNECGTILGGSNFRGQSVGAPSAAPAGEIAFTNRVAPSASDRIQIFDAGRSLPR